MPPPWRDRRGRPARGGRKRGRAWTATSATARCSPTTGSNLLDPEQEPVRYARLLVRRGRSRWRLNQARAAMADLDQGARHCFPMSRAIERARLLSWIARTHVVARPLPRGGRGRASAREPWPRRAAADHHRRGSQHARHGTDRARRRRRRRGAAAPGDHARPRAGRHRRPRHRIQQPRGLPRAWPAARATRWR